MVDPDGVEHREVVVAASSPAPPLQADEVLVGRYLLLTQLPGPGPALLWRAVDEVLARPVAVASLPADDPAAPAFLDAALRHGAVLHPGIARVHDAAVGGRAAGGGELALVVSEWVDGQSLDALLAAGPIEPSGAVGLLRQAADAVSALHAHGVVHGALHPGNVLVTPTGRLKLTSAGTAEQVTPAAVRRDTCDLAAVLYALLTGRWPTTVTGQPARQLPAAPRTGGRPLRPGQVRAGIPRQLDALLAAALDPLSAADSPELSSPAALAAAVDAAARDVLSGRPAAGPVTRNRRRKDLRPAAGAAGRGRLRGAAPWLGLLVLLGGVGAAGWLFGLAVGELPRRDDAVQALVSTTPGPVPGRPAPAALDLTRLPVRDYDPPPGDGQESPDTVRNAVDGDPSTAWVTSSYTTSDFGRLKHGLGLLLDLGRSRGLSQVQVGLTAAGASVQLRCADGVAPSADGFRTVAEQQDAGPVATLVPAAGARCRYWLVWLTALPRVGDGYRVGVAELRLR